MKPPGEKDVWTPPRLKARLAARKGLAPAPSCYVVWRATGHAAAPENRGYELPGETNRRDEAAFERWLLERDLAGAERLSVSVLVIREQLDEAGLIRECVLERRRGGVDGPYYGNVARVEFAGAAKRVRRYQASRDGRLARLPAEDETGTVPPDADADPEGFTGEDAAVQAYLGEGTTILDRRLPSLFEDLVGLSGIIHARRPDGAEVGCGVGWHGGTAFVLAADFPRHSDALTPPPDLEAAVQRAVATRNLVRYETRLEEHGFRVIARERGRQSLVAIRRDGKATRIDPYVPGRIGSATEDQRRWMSYAETYEARTILDSWRDGDGDDLAVLTIDPEQEAWRHVIDPEGIEISRQSDNDAAAAVLWRERLNPPEDASFGAPSDVPLDARPDAPAGSHRASPPDLAVLTERARTEYDAPADSLLAKALAWSRAVSVLSEAIASHGAGQGADHAAGVQVASRATLDRLGTLVGPLTALNATFSIGTLRRLMSQMEGGMLVGPSVAPALNELLTRLRDELALTRIVTLPSTEPGSIGEPRFGPLVELHFSAAAYDIEEAARCLALRRSTASVLHAMKVMRHGLDAIERSFSTPPLTALDWSRVIAEVRRTTADRDVIHALGEVRRAWRAPGPLPADKYTEEEAASVLSAVEAFMRALAMMLEAGGEAL